MSHLPRLRDDEFIDEIRITTVPRFKTSELSGDEWRTSIRVVALRKGRVVGERDWNRLEWALPRLTAWIQDDLLCPVDDPRMTDDLCMQSGCAEPFTVEYRVLKQGCSCGQQKRLDSELLDYRRRFCARHASRGDSNLDDMDSIYAPVGGGQPPAEFIGPAESKSVLDLSNPPSGDLLITSHEIQPDHCPECGGKIVSIRSGERLLAMPCGHRLFAVAGKVEWVE